MKTLFLSYLTVRLWCMTLAFVVQSEFPRTTAKMLEHLIVFSITGKLNTQTYAIQLSESCHAYTHCQCVEQTHSGICHKETENPELSEQTVLSWLEKLSDSDKNSFRSSKLQSCKHYVNIQQQNKTRGQWHLIG